MSVDLSHVILSPIITEESQIQTAKANQYTFKVSKAANKHQIRKALEEFFPNIKITRVNTMNYEGKTRRNQMSRKVGRRSGWKKAVVTLRAGDSIDLI
jgi:large subunit ribosomal protein L23